jgi:DNA-directed RNA polymerase subunit M/transcription elongation factor TFIIS
MEIEIVITLIIIALLIAFIIYKTFWGGSKAVTASANFDNIEEGSETDLKCLRCFDKKMIYNGTQRFHVGSNSAPFIIGDVGELFVNKQTFDLYYCPKCGKVEFYYREKGA